MKTVRPTVKRVCVFFLILNDFIVDWGDSVHSTHTRKNVFTPYKKKKIAPADILWVLRVDEGSTAPNLWHLQTDDNTAADLLAFRFLFRTSSLLFVCIVWNVNDSVSDSVCNVVTDMREGWIIVIWVKFFRRLSLPHFFVVACFFSIHGMHGMWPKRDKNVACLAWEYSNCPALWRCRPSMFAIENLVD